MKQSVNIGYLCLDVNIFLWQYDAKVGGVSDAAKQHGKKDWAVTEKDKTKQLTLRMPEHLHRAFKLAAVKTGRTMGAVTIELIEKYVKKNI